VFSQNKKRKKRIFICSVKLQVLYLYRITLQMKKGEKQYCRWIII